MRARVLQRGLHQRPRADPVAHADRASAALSGSQVDARLRRGLLRLPPADRHQGGAADARRSQGRAARDPQLHHPAPEMRSEEHTSELQSLMRISYAVFCLKKKNTNTAKHNNTAHT